MSNPAKTNTVRELGSIDVTRLKEKVSAISPEEWQRQNDRKPNKFDVFDATQHIVFRFIDSFQDHRAFTDKPIWEEWKREIEPIMAKCVEPYGYTNGAHPRIMLAKLKAKSEVGKHIDKAPAAQFPHKIHVPLFTNENCFFHVAEQSFHMEEGKAYEVNNNILHSASNGGDTDRIHLIFEYFPR